MDNNTNTTEEVVEPTVQMSAKEASDNMTREEFEAELKQNTALPPEDIAAAFFKLEYPRFKAMLDTLSRNELERLCLNLAGGELVPIQNQLKSEKEKTAYYLGAQMAQNRMIMQLAFEMQKAQEAEQILNQKNEQTQGGQNGSTSANP